MNSFFYYFRRIDVINATAYIVLIVIYSSMIHYTLVQGAQAHVQHKSGTRPSQYHRKICGHEKIVFVAGVGYCFVLS